MILPSSATRCSRLVCENVSKARRAAATALSTSALEPSASSYIASSVAGLTTGVDFLPTGSTQAPSMENGLRLTLVHLGSIDPTICPALAAPAQPVGEVADRSIS